MLRLPAHIAGTVARVERQPGDRVSAGDAIVILESRGLEMPLESPVEGRVKEIRVKEGQTVAAGDVLVVLE